jgi:hypothetical protein
MNLHWVIVYTCSNLADMHPTTLSHELGRIAFPAQEKTGVSLYALGTEDVLFSTYALCLRFCILVVPCD